VPLTDEFDFIIEAAGGTVTGRKRRRAAMAVATEPGPSPGLAPRPKPLLKLSRASPVTVTQAGCTGGTGDEDADTEIDTAPTVVWFPTEHELIEMEGEGVLPEEYLRACLDEWSDLSRAVELAATATATATATAAGPTYSTLVSMLRDSERRLQRAHDMLHPVVSA
jgi:hypothetical protein